MIQEFYEAFKAGDRTYYGIFSIYDDRSDLISPGILSPVQTLLVSDEVARGLTDRIVIEGADEKLYRIKHKTRSGIGLTELDLEAIDQTSYQGEF